jgi:DNA-binding transcriptional LysR family regulator
MKEAVAAGLGHGMLFEGETTDDPRLGFVPFRAPEIVGLVCAVCLREMRAVPAVAAFMDLAIAPPATGR